MTQLFIVFDIYTMQRSGRWGSEMRKEIRQTSESGAREVSNAKGEGNDGKSTHALPYEQRKLA